MYRPSWYWLISSIDPVVFFTPKTTISHPLLTYLQMYEYLISFIEFQLDIDVCFERH